MVKAEFDRSVGPFKDNFINVLADNLGSLLSTERIYLFPWRQSVPIDYQITVDVVRCDGRLGDAVWLEVRWSIIGGPERKLLKVNRSSIREPVNGADYDAMVAAQSQALAKLSQEIAEAIQTAGRTEAKPASPAWSTAVSLVNSVNGMTTTQPHCVPGRCGQHVLDNDRIQDDLKRHIEREFGAECRDRFWAIQEELFNELGYRDYLGALQRFRVEHPYDPHLVTAATFLVDYPFADRLFTGGT